MTPLNVSKVTENTFKLIQFQINSVLLNFLFIKII